MKLWEMTREQLAARVMELETQASTLEERRELNEGKVRLLDLKCPRCGESMPYGRCAEPGCTEFNPYAWRADDRCVLCGQPAVPAWVARVRLPSGAIALLELGGMYSRVSTPVRRLCGSCCRKHISPLIGQQLVSGKYLVVGENNPGFCRQILSVVCGDEHNPKLDHGDPKTWLEPSEPPAGGKEDGK